LAESSEAPASFFLAGAFFLRRHVGEREHREPGTWLTDWTGAFLTLFWAAGVDAWIVMTETRDVGWRCAERFDQ